LVATEGTLIVTPAPLTVTAEDASRPVGAPNPAFNAVLAGFVLGEDASVLSGALSITTPATPASPDGLFPITPSGLSSDNYAITFVDGTLTVGAGAPVPPVPPAPPASPVVTAITADDVNDAGVASRRLAGLRGAPLTPGDASFRVSDRDVALAEANPFVLTFSLGEVAAFSVAGAPAPTGGFVPAAGVAQPGGEDEAGGEGFVPAAGSSEPAAGVDCGPAVNLGTADRGICQSVTVTETYWATR
jgi:hypothetical protein